MNLKNRNRTHRAIEKGLFKWNSKWTYESNAYLERFANVYFTGGKVENSTVLILRKRCFLLTCRKITFPYKGHCYCWVNVQKFRSLDSLTYGRRHKTRTFILFSKVLTNNCIDRYSLQQAQRKPHHLNNRLVTRRERQLTTWKRAEKTKRGFRCSIGPSAIG